MKFVKEDGFKHFSNFDSSQMTFGLVFINVSIVMVDLKLQVEYNLK